MMPSTKISQSPLTQVLACWMVPPRDATARHSVQRFNPHCWMLFITCQALNGPRYKSPCGDFQRSKRVAVHPASRNSCSQLSAIYALQQFGCDFRFRVGVLSTDDRWHCEGGWCDLTDRPAPVSVPVRLAEDAKAFPRKAKNVAVICARNGIARLRADVDRSRRPRNPGMGSLIVQATPPPWRIIA